MSTELVVGFANVGRGGVSETEQAIDIVAGRMNALTRSGRPGLLFLNEIDEADRANEHGILNSAMRPWDSAWWDSREPLMHKGFDVKSERSWAGSPGVAHQSPSRRLHELILDGGDEPDLAALGGHYPAGAKNGERPPAARAALIGGYTKMLARHRARLHRHHDAGRHAVWAMDVNWRAFPSLHRREGTVRRHGPDYIRVLPARGWEASRGSNGAVDLGVEALHRLEFSVITFRPIKH